MTSDYYLFCIKDGKPVWKCWKLKSECTDEEMQQANVRSLMSNEICLDIDIPETKDRIVDDLNNKGVKYELWATGGKGFHIMLYNSSMEELTPEDRKSIRASIITRYNCDITKSQDRTLIGIENVSHRKTGKNKTLIFSNEGNEVELPQIFTCPTELSDYVKIKPSSHSPKEGKSIVQINGFLGVKPSSNSKYNHYAHWDAVWYDMDTSLKNNIKLPLYDCVLESAKRLTTCIIKLMEGRRFPIFLVIYVENRRPYVREIKFSEVETYRNLNNEEVQQLFELPDRLSVAKKHGGHPHYLKLWNDVFQGNITKLSHTERLNTAAYWLDNGKSIQDLHSFFSKLDNYDYNKTDIQLNSVVDYLAKKQPQSPTTKHNHNELPQDNTTINNTTIETEDKDKSKRIED